MHGRMHVPRHTQALTVRHGRAGVLASTTPDPTRLAVTLNPYPGVTPATSAPLINPPHPTP